MDKLKALLASKTKENKEIASLAHKGVFSKAELEQTKLRKVREEEAKEREEKVKRNSSLQVQPEPVELVRLSSDQLDSPTSSSKELSKEEVVRRLRSLGQPATLFGEDDYMRIKRLKKAEKEQSHKEADDDDALHSGRGNQLIDQQRKAKKTKQKDDKPRDEDQQGTAQPPAARPQDEEPEPDDMSVEASFKRAALRLKRQREEEALPLEDVISRYLQGWCTDWATDLERRSDDVKASPSGYQATQVFNITMTNFRALFDRLKRRQLNEELLTGLWMMVRDMRDRNYIGANDTYLGLAIGNAPWPIGVTSVGIHERSAREKISHVMNAQGQAHIMNDEATRKYFQALKRLITHMQRMYPAAPSRCVDFGTMPDPGKGASGAGSAKVALLEAEASGAMPLALPAARHFLDHDNSVRIPEKWNDKLRRERVRSPSPEAV